MLHIDEEIYVVTGFKEETNFPMRVGRKAIEGISLFNLLNLFNNSGRTNAKDYTIQICYDKPRASTAVTTSSTATTARTAYYVNSSEDEGEGGDDDSLPEFLPLGQSTKPLIKKEYASWNKTVCLFLPFY